MQMNTVALSPNLTMLRIRGWQVYIWRAITVGAGSRIRETAATLIG